jgi:hypothetical protein
MHVRWAPELGRLVHRHSYREFVGPIPDGYDVHHNCENVACFNPEHLRLMPDAEHRRLHAEARRAALGPYCRRGHLRAEHMVKHPTTGWLYCRQCVREWRPRR